MNAPVADCEWGTATGCWTTTGEGPRTTGADISWCSAGLGWPPTTVTVLWMGAGE
jgi:hypothetical protein